MLIRTTFSNSTIKYLSIIYFQTFWDYVNDCINGLLNRNAPNSKQQSSRHTLGPCKNSELFCLWIICNLSRLYGYNSDGTYSGSKCSRVIVLIFLIIVIQSHDDNLHIYLHLFKD